MASIEENRELVAGAMDNLAQTLPHVAASGDHLSGCADALQLAQEHIRSALGYMAMYQDEMGSARDAIAAAAEPASQGYKQTVAALQGSSREDEVVPPVGKYSGGVASLQTYLGAWANTSQTPSGIITRELRDALRRVDLFESEVRRDKRKAEDTANAFEPARDALETYLNNL